MFVHKHSWFPRPFQGLPAASKIDNPRPRQPGSSTRPPPTLAGTSRETTRPTASLTVAGRARCVTVNVYTYCIYTIFSMEVGFYWKKYFGKKLTLSTRMPPSWFKGYTRVSKSVIYIVTIWPDRLCHCVCLLISG